MTIDKRPPRTTEVRYELKVPFDAAWLTQARGWIHLHHEGFRTAYPARQVNNLYLDSPGLTDLAESLAGQAERRKLRLRWYGAATETAVQSVLELKIKRGSVGDKRRYAVAEPFDLSRPFAQSLNVLRGQVPVEWREWLDRATQPALINQYRREYYVSPDGTVRCTLDYQQRFYDQRFGLRPNLTRRLMADEVAVIEIKAPVELGERLEAAMNSFPAARRRHSKYVDGLRNSSF